MTKKIEMLNEEHQIRPNYLTIEELIEMMKKIGTQSFVICKGN